MTDNELSVEVVRLIDHVIASMDHVTVLRHLALAAGDTLTIEALAGLHVDRGTLVRVLRDLHQAGVVREARGGYRYASSSRDDAAIAELLDLYNTRPVTLIRAVYGRATARTSFAGASKVRRDD